MTKFQAKIVHQGCNCPRESDNARIFGHTMLEADTMEELWQKLRIHYNVKKLKITENNGVYIGSDNKRIGFIRKFWNSSYDYKKNTWWQIDWVTFSKITEEYVII